MGRLSEYDDVEREVVDPEPKQLDVIDVVVGQQPTPIKWDDMPEEQQDYFARVAARGIRTAAEESMPDRVEDSYLVSDLVEVGPDGRIVPARYLPSVFPRCAVCGARYEDHEEVDITGARGHRINRPDQPMYHGLYHLFSPLPHSK